MEIYIAENSQGKTLYERMSLSALRNAFINDHQDGNSPYAPDIASVCIYDTETSNETPMQDDELQRFVRSIEMRCEYLPWNFQESYRQSVEA